MGRKAKNKSEVLVEQVVSQGKILESDGAKLPQGVLCRVTYPICNIGELNRNNRRYDRSVWEKVLDDPDIQEKLKSRSLFGHAEHPKDTSQSSTEKISHVVNDIKIDDKDGIVRAEVDVLDTPYGRICDTLLRAGCGLGVSTRAEGELAEKEENGKKYYDVVPESYKLRTVDFTADPSTYGAYPESVERDLVGIVKQGVDDGKIEQAYATVMLESMKVDEAKSLLETIKSDKHHEGCKCKASEKKCTHGCPNASEKKGEVPAVVVKEVQVPKTQWLCPHCQKEIGEKELFQNEQGQDFHSPCVEKGPIKLPEGFAPMSAGIPYECKSGETIGYHGREGTIVKKDGAGYIVHFKDTNKEEWIDADDLKAQNEKKVSENIYLDMSGYEGEDAEEKLEELQKKLLNMGIVDGEHYYLGNGPEMIFMDKAAYEKAKTLLAEYGITERVQEQLVVTAEGPDDIIFAINGKRYQYVGVTPPIRDKFKRMLNHGAKFNALHWLNKLVPKDKRYRIEGEGKEQKIVPLQPTDEFFGSEGGFLAREAAQSQISDEDLKKAHEEAKAKAQNQADYVITLYELLVSTGKVKPTEFTAVIQRIRKLSGMEESINEDAIRVEFEDILKKIQDEIDIFSPGEKKHLNESKTIVEFHHKLFHMILEARKHAAISGAELEKALEISDPHRVEELEKRYAADMLRMNDKVNEIKTLLNKQLQTLKEQHSVELNTLREAFAQEKKLFGEKLLEELKKIYDQKINEIKKHYEERILEMKAEHEEDLFQKTVVDVMIHESKLKLPENAITLLRKCRTQEEVADLLSRMRYAIKEGMIHGSRPDRATVHIEDTTANNPLLAQTAGMVRTLNR